MPNKLYYYCDYIHNGCKSNKIIQKGVQGTILPVPQFYSQRPGTRGTILLFLKLTAAIHQSILNPKYVCCQTFAIWYSATTTCLLSLEPIDFIHNGGPTNFVATAILFTTGVQETVCKELIFSHNVLHFFYGAKYLQFITKTHSIKLSAVHFHSSKF